MMFNKLKYISQFGLIVMSGILTLSGCVTVHKTVEPTDAEFSPVALQDIAQPTLKVVKKRMSACVSQFAIATEKTNDLRIDFNAENQRIVYKSPQSELVNYMQVCAGERYAGEDKDQGHITISSNEA